jgi:hypothetical protein
MNNVLLARQCIVKARRAHVMMCVLMFQAAFILRHVTCDVTCAVLQSRVHELQTNAVPGQTGHPVKP